MKLGSIPQNLTFFIKSPQKVSWRWEDVEGGIKEFEVLPCYISDSDNKNTLETGKTWAEAGYWDYKTQKHVKTNSCEILQVKNKPFNNLRIITLEIRDKGGRAYKVCADIGDKKNLYFDMREDVLLDAIFNIGINPGGEVPGEFIFARVGSQMKPIRLGSFLHDKMIESTKYNQKGKCELVVGGIYPNKKGELSIYMGEYWTRDPKIELQNVPLGYHYNREVIKSLSFGPPIKVHVFHNYRGIKYALKGDKNYDIWFHTKTEKNYHQIKGDPTAYELQIVKNHSFKEQIGQTEIPENYIEKLKNHIIEKDGRHDQQYRDLYPDYLLKTHTKLLGLSKDKDFVHPLLIKYVKQ